MLVDYTRFLFENYGKENFTELAIERLLEMLPPCMRDYYFARNLLLLMKHEEIHLKDGFTVNLMLHVVCKDGQQLDLTPNEVKVVEILVKSRGEVVSSEKIIDEVWGYSEDNSILKVNICNIRKKTKLPIHAVKGSGYVIEAS